MCSCTVCQFACQFTCSFACNANILKLLLATMNLCHREINEENASVKSVNSVGVKSFEAASWAMKVAPTFQKQSKVFGIR